MRKLNIAIFLIAASIGLMASMHQIVSQPEERGGCEGDGEGENLKASVMMAGNPAPILEPAGRDLDPVASFVTTAIEPDILFLLFLRGMRTRILLSFDAS
jgi:hypothetical protein